MAEFEPRILAICCWWCSYGAADLAGTGKMEYPTSVRIVRVPCTGRVDPLHVLQAFQDGADGVIVAGCLKDGCHYIDGNVKAEARVLRLKEKLKAVGLGDERLEMYFMSAAQSDRFVQAVTGFTERIVKLGPSPLRR